MNVVIDGIEYVPCAEIPRLTNQSLYRALRELVAIQYFNETHKNRAVAWDALAALSPALASLAADDPHVAYAYLEKIKPDELLALSGLGEWASVVDQLPTPIQVGDGSYPCDPQESVIAAILTHGSVTAWNKQRYCADGQWRSGNHIGFIPTHWMRLPLLQK